MIAKLLSNLYLSGANEVHNVEELKRLGITAVLNVAYEVSDPHHKDFVMVKIGLHEFKENPAFLKNMAIEAIRKLIDHDHTVLIHCYAGAHRSPFIAFSYIAEVTGDSLDEVYKDILPGIPWGVVYPHSIK